MRLLRTPTDPRRPAARRRTGALVGGLLLAVAAAGGVARADAPAGGRVLLAGRWQSNLQLVYRFTQRGASFEWTVEGLPGDRGTGRQTAGDLETEWTKDGERLRA